MTQQIKIAEYLNYLYTCKRISSANIIAFLVDMFHKAKYGEFLSFLVEDKDKLYTQDDAYRIFVQYIKDYILFDILPYGKRSL